VRTNIEGRKLKKAAQAQNSVFTTSSKQVSCLQVSMHRVLCTAVLPFTAVLLRINEPLHNVIHIMALE
jgi:hypothetical protein